MSTGILRNLPSLEVFEMGFGIRHFGVSVLVPCLSLWGIWIRQCQTYGLIPCPEKPPSLINKIGIITFIYSCEEDSVMKLFSYHTLTPSLEPYLVSPIQSVWIPMNSSFKLNVESGHLSLSPLPYWSIPLSGHLWTSAPAPHCCLCVHKLWSF